MAEYPDNRYYSERHIWVQPNMKKGTAKVGFTDYLLEEFASIDSLDLPMAGDELETDALCIHVHIGNRIRHFRCPLTGRATLINQDVQDNPSLLYLDNSNDWLFEMEFDEKEELENLLSGSQYANYLDKL